MGKFIYKAKQKDGEIISSFIEAATKDEAIDKISHLGYYPLSVEADNFLNRQSLFQLGFFSVLRIRSQVTNFTKQLKNLLKSGMPILRSLNLLLEQEKHSGFKTVLGDVFVRVRDGQDLSSSVNKYPQYFDKFYISMVKVGEKNGTLPEMLERISLYRKQQDEITSKIKGALAYPAFVLMVGIATVFFILTNVMPNLIGLIESMNAQIPRSTAILINSTQFLQNNVIIILIAILSFILLLRLLYYNRSGKITWDKFKLKLPLYGKLVLQSQIIKFARTLETSLNSGLQVLPALNLTAEVIDNELIKQEIYNYCEKIKSGSSLGSCLKKSQFFPKMISDIITVGEESGKLSGVLSQIAEDNESNLSESTRLLVSLIEPLVILLIGIVIGYIVMALLMPVFQMDVLAG